MPACPSGKGRQCKALDMAGKSPPLSKEHRFVARISGLAPWHSDNEYGASVE